MAGRQTNWAGNVVYRAHEVSRPSSLAGLREALRATSQARVLGTGHSFNRIADTPGLLVSLAGLPPVIDIDPGRSVVSVGGGVTYDALAPALSRAGFALPSLASLAHLSVAGACATASHGSGDGNGNLATTVSEMELLTAADELVTLRRDTHGDQFRGAVVSLGALGVVTRLTLDLVPAFEVRQYVYEGLPATMLSSHFDEIFSSGYSVSVFTDWQGGRHQQLWVKLRDGQPTPAARWMDTTPASRPVHPIAGQPPRNATPQLGEPGPWHERLPHFRAGTTPSVGQELQSEYLLPRQLAAGALDVMASLASVLKPVLQVCEIRTVAPDDLWLSPSYQRDTVALHFTWVPDTAAVTPVIATIEQLLNPLGARPHWGKLFGTPPHALRALYPRCADFQALLRQYDPGGKFRNGFLDKYFPA
jgi:xylitol oxidase